MQILVKNLHNQEWKVDCEGDRSIKELKEKIAQEGGNAIGEKYNPELIKLLYKGKVMEDEDAVDNYSIDADGFVVLVKQLPGKPKPPPKKKPQYQGFNNQMGMGGLSSNAFGGFSGFTASGMMPSPLQQNPFGSSTFPLNSFPQSTYNPSASATTTSSATNQFNPSAYVPSATGGAVGGGFGDANPEDFTTFEDREGALRSLVGMGFDEDLSQQALHASFYNVETAIDLITSGKISKSSKPVTSQSTASSKEPPVQTQKSTPKPPSPTSSDGGGMNSQLQQISQMLQSNPEQLQVIKQSIQDEHPEIAQMIDENPETFLDMLKQVSVGAESTQPNPPPPSTRPNPTPSAATAPAAPTAKPTAQTVTLTLREQQIIDQFQAMGFDRERAIEAFLLANRNEQVAANILLN